VWNQCAFVETPEHRNSISNKVLNRKAMREQPLVFTNCTGRVRFQCAVETSSRMFV